MQQPWWKDSVIYQIYPRSFMDSNGDGIGDLPGIISRLDYIQQLGVDVVWLSPIYKSPNDDMGYDISDYRDIMDEFGTLADWEALRDGLHQRGIKLVMDLVVNHTSDAHPWFRESRKSRDNPYRDFYIWRPGRDGREPNNWRSFFGGSAWEYDELTGEYYLHLFSRRQPDLNWENPQVRREIYDMMRWWLDRGVNGFRMDVITMISKVEGLPDAPVVTDEPYQWGGDYFIHGPRMMEFLQEMRAEVLAHYDALTIGEAVAATPAHAIELTDREHGPLDMLIHFEHMALDHDPGGPAGYGWRPWNLAELKEVTTRWQEALAERGWNSQYFSNHDQPRQVSRFGDDGRYRVESAKLLGTFLHMLHGTPFIYQGEEIGMTNVAFDSIDAYRDIETINHYRLMLEDGVSPAEAMALVHKRSRDNARTPMQWDASPHGGFTTGNPWIGVNPNYREINVEQALTDPNSIFYYYRELIRLRKENPVIIDGRYKLILADHPEIYAFTRTLGDDRLLVILNFSSNQPVFNLPEEVPAEEGELLIANYAVEEGVDFREFPLRPWEARVYRLAPPG